MKIGYPCINRSVGAAEAAARSSVTWRPEDGILMTDYSTQMPGGRRGRHAVSLDPTHFEQFLAGTASTDIDIRLKIKDKEKSALAAVGIARKDGRFLLPADRHSSKE